MRRILAALLALGLAAAHAGAAPAGDFLHWRGPKQTGEITGANLPDTFDLDAVGQGGLLWKTRVGGRSAPLLMDGKLFILNGFDNRLPTEGERVSCLDAQSGKVLWEHKFNVYHADVVTSRLGWTTIAADPRTRRIYTHTTAGALVCFDTAGKIVWQRQLTEEFGRFTGYGGRIVSPVYDSGLVIVAIVNSSWGDMARGSNRFLAFDANTGAVEWIGEPNPLVNKGTYQSTPVVAVIGGQRLLIAGGSDGSLHAMKVRTGERVWSYLFGAGAINPSPVVDGNLVYGAHGEENPEGGSLGRVVCVDGSKVDAKTKKPKLVWEYRRSNRFGLSHPALADGRLYVPDDSSELFCFNAKTGKLLWRYKYGTTPRGAPVIIDNKLYVFDVNAKLSVLKLRGDEEPDPAEVQEYTFRLPEGEVGFNETHGTPIAADGRMYFTTTFDTYCVGTPQPKPGKPFALELGAETPFDPNAKPAGLRVTPFEAHAKPGDAVLLTAIPIDANGRDLKPAGDAKAEWSIAAPPAPKLAAPKGGGPPVPTGPAKDKDAAPPAPKTPPPAPPLLKAELKPEGFTATVTLDKTPGQAGYVGVKVGELTARARIRAVPQLPYTNDFEKIPVGAAPGGWVNAQGKFVVKQLPDGSKVLSKVNTDGRPPIARANGYITAPSATGYRVECDLYATEVLNKLPDMGTVVDRYTLVLDGKTDPDTKKRAVRIASWDARPRVDKRVPFQWMPDTWYRTKLVVTFTDKTALVKAKVWPKSEMEPAEWTVEYEDASPNREGAAAVYGYVSNSSTTNNVTTPGSEIYYDNLSVAPNGK